MKYIKKYRMFESRISAAEKKIIDFCHGHDIEKYNIQYDYKSEFSDKPIISGGYCVDVNEDMNLSYLNARSLPIKIRNVDGYFSVNDNEFKNFKNFPKYISGDFDFSQNQIRFIDENFPIVDGTIIGWNNPYTNITTSDLTKLKVNDAHILLEDSPFYQFIIILDEDLPISLSEAIDKLEEFEVIIDNNKIDLISLQSLFEFYEKEFDEVKFKKTFRDSFFQMCDEMLLLKNFYKLI